MSTPKLTKAQRQALEALIIRPRRYLAMPIPTVFRELCEMKLAHFGVSSSSILITDAGRAALKDVR